MDNKSTLSIIKNHTLKKVKLAITDIDGILRGKVMSTDKFLSAAKDGFGFCDVVFGWDAGDVAYENSKFTGWHTGYPDAKAEIDLSTFRQVPWDNNIPFFLADFPGLDFCPRTLLKKLKKQAIEEFKVTPIFSQEFEWFNFKESPQSLFDKDYKNPIPLTPGMFGYSILRSSNAPISDSINGNKPNTFFNDIFDLMLKFNVPIEGLHTETGPGVLEAAIVYGDIIESADRANLFKTGVKEIAYRHNVMATFMAKWNTNLPGCGGHIHQSLWRKDKNIFYNSKDSNNMSETMKQYVAGQLHCMPHILPMVAPTINSYKRLVIGAWAPTTRTWGNDNRTTSLRVLTSGEKSARLETRVCGSDTNPYLAMAACLASGLYGIKHKLKLQPITTGNGYLEKKYGELPANLELATKEMKKSKVAIELFGEKFVEHFTGTRQWECDQFKNSGNKFNPKEITDWEMKRYFEII